MKPTQIARWKSKDFLLFILFLQFIFYALMVFDIPLARQVVGFLYLTTIPGFIFVKLLRLDELDGLETILFSVGLSIASLMFVGLLVNEFGLLLVISKPLSLIPLATVLNSFILLGAFLVYLRNDYVKLFESETLSLSLVVLFFVGFPVVSVIGAFLVNASGNSSILLFMILSIAVLFTMGILAEKLLPEKFYAFVIFAVAVALLFHSSLISNYIYGGDIHLEYYVFKLTQENAYWNSSTSFSIIQFSNLYSMLSITILPVVYSNMLNMDGTWVLKIVFPLILSFVPLALYKIWQKNLDRRIAFISAFFLMSQNTFYMELLGATRQIIAELFFVLLLFVLLSKKLDSTSSKICFTIFSIGLVVSHYAISIIFLFFLLSAWLYMFLTKRKSKNLTLPLILLFFAIMFSWYIYTSSSSSFEVITFFGDRIYRSLNEFLNPASRGTEVIRGLGLESPSSYWQAISRIFAYATEFLIFFGFIASMVKLKKVNFDREYVIFSSLAVVLLGMCILLPSFASTMRMSRFYHIILFFLAPFFVFGCEAFIGLLVKRKTQLYVSILIVIVLVPYFMFQTGFIYEITRTQNYSAPLSMYRMDKFFLYRYFVYIDEQSLVGAQWASKNTYNTHMPIYADFLSRWTVFLSYCMIYPNDINKLSNTTIVSVNGLIYMSKLNVVYGKIVGDNYIWNFSEFSPLDNVNKIYSNGGCEVYGAFP